VFLVVFLFLQNWRATLIPFAAVPVSLIGTFAGLYLLGYSINTLTLFGMVLAIGIVVDDAIVVLENVERIMHEEHLNAREAAVKAMTEVTSPIIAIVLVLCAVFVPIAFLGGLAGELYRQFAVTISIAVVISGTVALTLTPSLCVLILKRGHKQPGRFFEWFNDWFRRVTGRYAGGGYRNNAATIFVTQKDWDDRSVTASQLVGEVFMKTARIKEALVLAFAPPPIFGLGTAGGFEFYIQNHGEGGPQRTAEVLQQF